MPKMGIHSKAAEALAGYNMQTQPASSVNANIADTLFSATQQRVLALLYGQPERSFFTNEIISLAGGGSGAIQRELLRLADSGLATVAAVGGQRHYQANSAAPIYEELRSIVAKILGPADVLREALVPLGESLRLALLYGSVAKRNDSASSDIDLLLVSDTLTLEQIYVALAPAERQLSRIISPTLYTVSEFRQRRANANPFLSKVLAGQTIRLTEDRDGLLATG